MLNFKQEFKNVKQYKYMYLGKYGDCRFVSSLHLDQTFKMLITLHRLCFILCVKFEQPFSPLYIQIEFIYMDIETKTNW